MLASLIAAGTAFILSFRHQFPLRIRKEERSRYFLKSVNLALCYRGFAPNRSLVAARNAGVAAFYCCAYDVVTDWRGFDETYVLWFKNLVTRQLSPPLAAIAIGLYEQERRGALALDGLSRGIDALAFVSLLIGSNEHIRQNMNFDHLGVVMQIVDDVLDLEDDQRLGEFNCLLTSPIRRTMHLQTLTAFDLNRFKSIFPHARVLCAIIRSAQKKATRLLSTSAAALKEFPSINARPYQNIKHKQHAEITCDVSN